MLASTTMRPVTPQTCAISSTTSAASRKPRPAPPYCFRDRHPEEAGLGKRLHIVPRVLLAAIDLGSARRDGLARQRPRTLLQLELRMRQRHDSLGLLRHQRHEIIFADALQDQEGERRLAGVGDQMRPPGPDRKTSPGLRFTFSWLLQVQPHLAFQHIEGIGDVGVGVPRHLLGRRELQLRDTKAGTRGMLRAALDFIEVTGVLDRLSLFHAGLPCLWRYGSLVRLSMKLRKKSWGRGSIAASSFWSRTRRSITTGRTAAMC